MITFSKALFLVKHTENRFEIYTEGSIKYFFIDTQFQIFDNTVVLVSKHSI